MNFWMKYHVSFCVYVSGASITHHCIHHTAYTLSLCDFISSQMTRKGNGIVVLCTVYVRCKQCFQHPMPAKLLNFAVTCPLLRHQLHFYFSVLDFPLSLDYFTNYVKTIYTSQSQCAQHLSVCITMLIIITHTFLKNAQLSVSFGFPMQL